MVNALFIDYNAIAGPNCSLMPTAVSALKSIASKVDDLRIVSIGTKTEMQLIDYGSLLSQLSQALSLKMSLFFDKLEVDSWDSADSNIASWIASHEVKSFAVVVLNSANSLNKAYPNNLVKCSIGQFSEAQAKDVLWIMSNYKSAISKDDNVWFVSDTHFGHANIIKYCGRPWNHGKGADGEIVVTPEDVLAMDNAMVERWNSVVGKNDTVWHLGDFALGGKEVAERVFPQLNGKINLVMGNHDHWKLKWYYDLGFHRVYDRPIIINSFVILSHTPLYFLNSNSPFFNCFGHVHNSLVYQTYTKCNCCVCVERHNYYPVSWKTIKEKYDEFNKIN